MAENKDLFLLMLILALIPGSINNLNININLSGKSKNKMKTYQESCIYDTDCGYGLSCISYICKCKRDEFWNSTYCVWKVVLYFTTSNYTTSEINNYNGTVFNMADDIKVIEEPNYFIYVCSDNSDVVVQYDQSGTYIRHTSVPGAIALESVNNTSIYATSWTSESIYKFDTNLNVINNTVPANSTYVQSSRSIRYNPSNGYIYVCDYITGYVNVLDLDLNIIASESLQFNSNHELFGIDFYQSSTLGDLIFLTTYQNSIKIVNRSNKTVIKTLHSVCSFGRITGILIHQKSSQFLVSCLNNDIVQLWYTDGTNFFNTGKTIRISRPYGMTSDSNGRLMIARLYDGAFSIFTPNI